MFCFRFFATGDWYKSLGFSYRVSLSVISQFVPEVCSVIRETMSPMHERMPADEADWKLIAENFRVLWDFPHCLGALGGKHDNIKAPAHSDALYYNFMGTFSFVVMGLFDSRYEFITLDVGAFGHNSDGGIMSNSNMGIALDEGRLHIANSEPFPDAPQLGDIPYIIVVVEAFPLKKSDATIPLTWQSARPC